MIDRCRQEVRELHQFFEDWFRKRLPDTSSSFSRVEDVLSDSFKMITPGGDLINRKPLLDGIRASYGQYLEDGKPDAIWIEEVGARQLTEDLCLYVYKEWQGDDQHQSGRGRISTALFRNQPGVPNNVSWIHLHETWLR
ncbi:MAG: hypothetical protein R3211_09100 [Balneolaceae bacterium]|nr:hypothetical protein [Balneolaceae bacterium]